MAMIKMSSQELRRRLARSQPRKPGENRGELVHNLSFLGLVTQLFAETAD